MEALFWAVVNLNPFNVTLQWYEAMQAAAREAERARYERVGLRPPKDRD